jgi:hypothetical protein
VEVTGQRECPFGDAALQFEDAVLAAETCEELFTPLSPNISLALSGATPPIIEKVQRETRHKCTTREANEKLMLGCKAFLLDHLD